ncbi:hypothetical protein RMN57_21205 [Kitasatospora sp. CM 4170]|uniref:Uncharacterized protein n=1 Tax=Kitasatospora aburaviensis TaxID=67265 RepID=A0ABW1EZA7_9ACTN|nr:hypothetical protein [Kitasatospora sp. CM 4170]WNM47044.1 hypothetical protein RMN57_21205 [Kitasatospora sp. CM 4170]
MTAIEGRTAQPGATGRTGLTGSGTGVAVWGVAYAVFGTVCAVTGTPLFGTDRLGWAVAAVGAAAAAAGAVASRSAHAAPAHRGVLRPVLLTLCGLAGAAAFGLLMDVITLLFSQAVDSGPGAALHALSALGALLLAATAHPARTAGAADARAAAAGAAAAAARTGRPQPSAASGPVQLAALAASLAFVPYVGMKLTWAFGGTFAGVSGAEMRAAAERNGASGLWLTLESWGVDATALLAALGVFLLWGLVRPWGQVFPRWTLLLHGRRVPRWLPLTPALLGAATLAPYGLVGIGYAALATTGLVTVPLGDFPTEADVLLVCWIGLGAFAVYGVALAAAARSYWHRTATGPLPPRALEPTPGRA